MAMVHCILGKFLGGSLPLPSPVPHLYNQLFTDVWGNICGLSEASEQLEVLYVSGTENFDIIDRASQWEWRIATDRTVRGSNP